MAEEFSRSYDLGHDHTAMFWFGRQSHSGYYPGSFSAGVSVLYDHQTCVTDMEGIDINEPELDFSKLASVRRADKVEHIKTQYRLARVHFLKELALVLKGVAIALEDISSFLPAHPSRIQQELNLDRFDDDDEFEPMSYRDGEWVESVQLAGFQHAL
jgi:hypothetical protein